MEITCMPAHVSLEVGGLGVQLPAPSMLAWKHFILFLRRTVRVRLLTLMFTARWVNRPLFEVPKQEILCYVSFYQSEAEFLDEIQTKVLRVFLLAIHSHLYSFALSIIFLQTHATSYSFYSSVTVHCKNLIKNHTPFPMV
jgi:hypothetical protein